jgi:ABC-type dipeptide/oligopeptide/nickel transport system permease subunit
MGVIAVGIVLLAGTALGLLSDYMHGMPDNWLSACWMHCWRFRSWCWRWRRQRS